MKKPLSDKESGTMEFTLGFYSKVTPGTSTSNAEIPGPVLEKEAYKKARKTTLTDLEAAVTITPPHEEFLSGILGIQVTNHTINSRWSLSLSLASRDSRTWSQTG
jgi:hypothetical protein